jgi:hypothetical protein
VNVREIAAWGLAVVFGLALFAEETRVSEATRTVAGYQAMAERVKEHDQKCIEKTIEQYAQRPSDVADD